MTADEPVAFGSLYYTDCLPGQGLAGGAGFQFQARSPGVDEAAQRTVQRTALYEVPSRWVREGLAVEDFPRSLAHVVDGVYVTAAGLYLGKEANGYRDGNQFTHAVVTTDPASYGLLRPAQLWGAPWWASAPAATTTCPDVPAPPEPGEGDIETVRERVRADPAGRARLTALVTALAALRGADRRRVLLVTDDGADAARWIAAATVLLDRRRALDVSFKIFVTDPDRNPHDVLVMHPDLLGSHARGSGYVVFDLRSADLPDPEPGAEARFWVDRFLDGDALDVVDAVELAGQLAGDGAPGHVERTAAALVVGLDDAIVDPGTLGDVARWLERAPSVVVETVGAALVRSLAARAGDPDTVAALDAAVGGRLGRPEADELGWVAAATEVRRRLFLLESDRAWGGHVVTGRLPEQRGAIDARTAEQHLDGAAAAHPRAALALADRHGLQPTDRAIEAFAHWWAGNADVEVDVLRWPFSQPVVEALCIELDRRLGAGTDGVREDVAQYWWRRPGELWRAIPVLGPTGPHDGLNALDIEIARAAHREGGEVRRGALAKVAETLAGQPRRDPWVGTWEFVLGKEPVPTADVRALVEAVPAAARSRPLAVVAYRSLLRAPGFDEDAQEALKLLEAAGWTPGEMGVAYPPDDPAVTEVVDALAQGPRADETQELGRRLRSVKHPTAADGRRLLDALVAASPAVAGRVLAYTGPRKLRDAVLLPSLRKVVSDRREHDKVIRAAAILFVCATKSFTNAPRDGRRQRGELGELVRGLSNADLRDVFVDLRDDRDRMPDDGVLDGWAGFMKESKRPVPPLEPQPPARRSPPEPPDPPRPAPEKRGIFGRVWNRG